MAGKKSSRKTKTSNISILSTFSSYQSLSVGFITVVILFVIVFFGYRLFSQKPKGIVTSEAIKTSVMEEEKKDKEGKYTVKEGDTLWSISESYYKTGFRWNEIAKANNISNPGSIEKGTILKIPKIESFEVALKPTENSTNLKKTSLNINKIDGISYKVAKGDNLWNIAVRAYGDGYKWIEIAKANKLANPDIIHSGNMLTIPR